MSFTRDAAQPVLPVWRPIIAALALAFGGAAQAQSLGEVFEAARSVDATWLGARAAADSASYRAEQVHALKRPGVSLQVSAGHSNADTSYSPASNSSATSSSGNQLDGKVVVQQSLFNRQSDLSIEQADKSVDVAQATLKAAEQDLIVRVAQAYFDVLSAEAALTSVIANEKAIAEQLASARRNFEVGNATITDTREAEARYDLARAQELVSRNDLEVKKVTLDQLVGRNGVKPLALALPAALPAVAPADTGEWLRMAEADNPSLQQARIALDVAKLETDKSRAGHLPTLSLQASWDKAHSNGQADIAGTTYNSRTNGFTGQVGVVLNVPLYSGGAVDNRVKETVLLQEQARNTLEGARNSVIVGTRTAFLGVQAGLAQIKALEAAEVSSKLALDATVLGYKVGVKVNIDVLNAQLQLFQTQRDLAKARHDYLVGTLKLRQAAGQLKADDLLGFNALLVKP